MTRREFAATAAVAVPATHAQPFQIDWRDQGILGLERSPRARLRNVPVRAVTLGDGFWAPRRRVNAERSIPTLFQLLEEHGIVDNFRRLSGRKDVARRGPLYTDSDLYKWMESVAFVLGSGDDAGLRRTFDRLTGEILATQDANGYINTYWSGERAAERFQRMEGGHELYCLGHMLQAAIAYYRATGNTSLLDGGIKFVNYLTRDFGPNRRPLLTGHPEFEMAVIELFRVTRDQRYLDLAGYLLTGDGERLKLSRQQMVYMFSGSPFTARTRLEGHAVRAMYACAGATDYYMETGDPQYWKTIGSLWDDLVTGKTYITGGVGARSEGEAFGEKYELPNARAYTESCAAIGSMMWNWRLVAATGESKHVDVIERALYNGINSGMSLDGTLYNYRNPLERLPDDKVRNAWYNTTCCPPNLERIFASLPGYFYSTGREGVYVHLYHSSQLAWRLEDGTPIKLEQKTNYPWEGDVEIMVSPGSPADFSLFVRVPAWSRSTKVTVNGQTAPGAATPGQYFAVRRRWQAGDRVTVAFDMTPRLMTGHPELAEDTSKAAVERGPLVYCLEALDQQGLTSLSGVSLPVGADPAKGFTAQFRHDLLGGMLVLKHDGRVSDVSPASALYEPLTWKTSRPVELTFIPYYAFANREATHMLVWVPYFRA
jgi:uncharacterized protein